jgi:nicotinamide phosphoribosyltransferase
MDNIILKTDSYKLNHWNQYPKGTTRVYSYMESRKGAMFPYTVFFGLQYLLRKNLAGRVVTQKHINEAEMLCESHFGSKEMFNRPMWQHILRNHNGCLPLRIKAVPEGTLVPESNIMMSVENTDDDCFSLTNGVESLLTHVWYPSTVATLSHSVKASIKRALEISAAKIDGSLDFMLHDFGYRGVSSDESSEIGGAAHLVNFVGTDTVPAIMLLADYYGNGSINPKDGRFTGIAYSVPATEHSIMTSLGRDGEVALVRQLIKDYPKGILSVVADSYDIYYFVSNIIGSLLKDEILARDGVFVVRPDSITDLHPTPESEMVWVMDALWDKFGGTTNSKGYKVLNPKVRVLWGDGLDKDGILKIINALLARDYSAENIAAFGMGGGLLQKVNRDTQRFAFKSSWQMRNGVGYDIFKEPKDPSKASKKGRLKLVRRDSDNGSILTTVPESASVEEDILQTVFLNGKVMKTYTLHEIRNNANATWPTSPEPVS